MSDKINSDKINSDKIKTYIKLGALGLMVLYAVLFIVINSREIATLWLFFGLEIRASVLWLIVIAVGLSLAGAWLIRQLRRSS